MPGTHSARSSWDIANPLELALDTMCLCQALPVTCLVHRLVQGAPGAQICGGFPSPCANHGRSLWGHRRSWEVYRKKFIIESSLLNISFPTCIQHWYHWKLTDWALSAARRCCAEGGGPETKFIGIQALNFLRTDF